MKSTRPLAYQSGKYGILPWEWSSLKRGCSPSRNSSRRWNIISHNKDYKLWVLHKYPHHIQRKESLRNKRVKYFQSRDLQLPSCMRRQHSPLRAMENWKETAISDSTRSWCVRVSGWVVSACHQDQVPRILRVPTSLPGEMYTWLRNNPEDSDGAGHTGSGPVCRRSWIIKSKVWMSQEH